MCNDEKAVVLKKLADSDDTSYDQKDFVKEARMFYSIQHENVAILPEAMCHYVGVFVF